MKRVALGLLIAVNPSLAGLPQPPTPVVATPQGASADAAITGAVKSGTDVVTDTVADQVDGAGGVSGATTTRLGWRLGTAAGIALKATLAERELTFGRADGVALGGRVDGARLWLADQDKEAFSVVYRDNWNAETLAEYDFGVGVEDQWFGIRGTERFIDYGFDGTHVKFGKYYLNAKVENLKVVPGAAGGWYSPVYEARTASLTFRVDGRDAGFSLTGREGSTWTPQWAAASNEMTLSYKFGENLDKVSVTYVKNLTAGWSDKFARAFVLKDAAGKEIGVGLNGDRLEAGADFAIEGREGFELRLLSVGVNRTF